MLSFHLPVNMELSEP